MMASHFFRSSMLVASLSLVSFLANDGALPPALLVLKNTGSIRSKSRSCCIRCIRTLPTMPRQPTRPTFMTSYPWSGQLPRNFARRVRAGKTGGHDGRSAFRDRFRGNSFDERLGGNGEFGRTGRFAVLARDRDDVRDLRHCVSLHENRDSTAYSPVPGTND